MTERISAAALPFTDAWLAPLVTDAGMVTREQLQLAQQEGNGGLWETAVRRGWARSDAIVELLARTYRLAVADLPAPLPIAVLDAGRRRLPARRRSRGVAVPHVHPERPIVPQHPPHLREHRDQVVEVEGEGRFLAEFASVNSFVETVFESQDQGEVVKWPSRTGRRPTI